MFYLDYITKKRIPGILCTVFGGIGTLGFGISSLVLYLVSRFTGFESVPGLLAQIFFFVGLASAILLAAGIKRLKTVSRLKRFAALLSKNVETDIPALSLAAHIPENRVLSEIMQLHRWGGVSAVAVEDERLILRFPGAADCIVLAGKEHGFRLLPSGNVRLETRHEKPAPRSAVTQTGDRETDSLARAFSEHVEQLRRDVASVKSGKVKEPLADIVKTCGDIRAVLERRPEKTRELRQIINYVLPTIHKLAESYTDMLARSTRGENIGASMRDIETAMFEMAKAFRRELDGLYRDKAVDISADIEVIKNLMGGDDDFA